MAGAELVSPGGGKFDRAQVAWHRSYLGHACEVGTWFVSPGGGESGGTQVT